MSRKIISHARALRKHQTDAENLLWRHLRAQARQARKFRRQHPLGPYIVDFICMSGQLIVELDGGQHFENADDRRRDAWLTAQGFRVLRFWNNEVLCNVDGVLWSIEAALEQHPLTPALSPKGARE